MTLRLVDFFCGAGGSSQGAAAVPGVEVVAAANHWATALESHALNFPAARHHEGDIHDLDLAKMDAGELFWASPECPKWSKARGRRRDFDNTTQRALCDELEPATDAEAERSRALMIDVPGYLAAMTARGTPVLGGVVENVIEVRAWDRWDWWLGEIRKLGYQTKVIALNSMHAAANAMPGCPQSRPRLYVGYWHTMLGRAPDWDKWLRPAAWCPDCDEHVMALQVFKNPRTDMGAYGSQYVYRCPRTSCRNRILEPPVLPALVAINWANPGTRIGDRKPTAAKPEGLAPATIARIRAGLQRYAMPVLSPCGGSWRDTAAPVTAPAPARTTRENDGIAVPPIVPPIVVEVGGNTFERTPGARTRPVTTPLTAQTATPAKALAVPPLPALVMRNNSSPGDGAGMSTPVTEPLRSLTTRGHQSLITWSDLLLPYYGNSTARPVNVPVGALTTRDRYGLASGPPGDIRNVTFRMLEPGEIATAMAFTPGYQVTGNRRQQIRQYGNAVTPNVAELLISALTEAITGHDLQPAGRSAA